MWFFTSRESINKTDKIQERALRYVFKDHTSSYDDLLLKSGFDSFRIYAVKSLMIELFKIFEGMTPDYLSELFVKADNPYDTRDKCKLVEPLKRTTTYGLRSFQCYGAHVWNMLPINIKAAQSLHEFKSFIRSWHMFMSYLHWFIIRNVTLLYWTPVCQCDGFVIACGTGGWFRGSPRCHRRCRFGGVFVTGGTGSFLLWKSPVRPAARVLRRDDSNFVPVNNFRAFDEIKHTDN